MTQSCPTPCATTSQASSLARIANFCCHGNTADLWAPSQRQLFPTVVVSELQPVNSHRCSEELTDVDFMCKIYVNILKRTLFCYQWQALNGGNPWAGHAPAQAPWPRGRLALHLGWSRETPGVGGERLRTFHDVLGEPGFLQLLPPGPSSGMNGR